MKRFVFLILTIAASAFTAEVVFAQASGISLEAEIQNIERTIAAQGIAAVQRHEALVRLARLRQLSGDIEGAARNWLEAAAAIPGRIDDDALLACAYCLAAMGEWDRAATALEPLLTKSAKARFLDFSIEAIRTGDTSSLAAIANNFDYSDMKEQIMFVLWKVSRGSSGERWRLRLVNEFPNTPEGRLAASSANAAGTVNRIIIKTSPFWLFAGGLDSLPMIETARSVQSASQTQTTTAQSVSVIQTASTARLQTGIFGRQQNAQVQAASLAQAGFSPSVEQRIAGNNEMWAVTVPTGTDQARTISQLRAAGFEAFLVR